jgi:hypothetical protein
MGVGDPVINAVVESGGAYRLRARPLHRQGAQLSTKPFRAAGLTKTMRALRLPEAQIVSIKSNMEKGADWIEIVGSGLPIPGIAVTHFDVQRVFSKKDLVAAGFDEESTE